MARLDDSDALRPVGLIAGEGSLPLITARGMREAGRRVVCVGLRDQYDAQLPGLCDAFAEAGIIRLGRWIRLLRRWGATEAVMVGRVRKARMYEPMRLVRQMPDWRAAWLWYRVLRHDKRNQTLLTAVADELQRGGVTLIDTTRYIPDHLASAGAMTRREPTAAQQADIDFALPILRGVIALDVGQSLAVKDRDVIAVEAIEGTDAMIQRAGVLCRHGGWTLVKAAGSGKDRRFDVPTIGVGTIAALKSAGAACLAVEAGGVILIDKPAVLDAADRAGITVVGVTNLS
jgi:DUF1009 family protein